MDEELRTIGDGALTVAAGFVAGAVLQYVLKIVLARGLGPGAYGVFVQGLAFAPVVAAAAINGLDMGVARFIGNYTGKEDAERVTGSLVTALGIGLPVALVAGGLVFANARSLALLFDEPALFSTLKLFAVAIPLMAVLRLLTGVLRGVGNARYKVYAEDLMVYGTALAAVLFFARQGLHLQDAIYAYVAGFAVAAAAAVHYVREVFPHRFTAFKPIPRQLLTFAWPLLVVSVVGVLNTYLDVFMLGWMGGSVRVGIYEVAISLASILYLFRVAGQYMFLPAVSERYAEEDIDRISELYTTMTRWVVTAALPVVAGFVLFPGAILALLLGAAYLPGAAPLAVLAVGVFLAAASAPAEMVLLASGRTKQLMVAVLAFAAVDAALNLVLIPRYGMVGAAVAMAAGFAVSAALSFGFVYRGLGIHPYTAVYPRLLLAAVLAAVPFYALTVLVDISPLFVAALGAGLVALYGWLVVRLDCVTSEDREYVGGLLEAVR